MAIQYSQNLFQDIENANMNGDTLSVITDRLNQTRQEVRNKWDNSPPNAQGSRQRSNKTMYMAVIHDAFLRPMFTDADQIIINRVSNLLAAASDVYSTIGVGSEIHRRNIIYMTSSLVKFVWDDSINAVDTNMLRTVLKKNDIKKAIAYISMLTLHPNTTGVMVDALDASSRGNRNPADTFRYELGMTNGRGMGDADTIIGYRQHEDAGVILDHFKNITASANADGSIVDGDLTEEGTDSDDILGRATDASAFLIYHFIYNEKLSGETVISRQDRSLFRPSLASYRMGFPDQLCRFRAAAIAWGENADTLIDVHHQRRVDNGINPQHQQLRTTHTSRGSHVGSSSSSSSANRSRRPLHNTQNGQNGQNVQNVQKVQKVQNARTKSLLTTVNK